MRRRVMVIGLDCAPPALVFDRFRAVMPNLEELARRGAHGPLRSVLPPITVPAWACMVSGRDPGELGLYGFRNRRPGSYELDVADGSLVTAPRVWDLVSQAGGTVAVLYVPLTSPPRPVEGVMVGGFLGPDGAPSTHPASLAGELEARFGPHAPDVSEHDSAEVLLDQLHETARQHFAVARAMWRERAPDFLMMVEMGPDRLHHALWPHLDPSHPKHDPSHRLVRAARDYYAFLDAEVGALVEEAGDDDAVLVVSDHGARTMRGGVRLNEWLREHGWLVLKEAPDGVTPLSSSMIDWSRTRAWGAGGYYGRVFLNVHGREPEGIVRDVEATAVELAAALEAMPGPGGPTEGGFARAHRPVDSYRAVKGMPPDLLVVFEDLAFRSLGTVGGPLYDDEDDRRDDGCNHDWDGVFIAAGGGVQACGRLEGLSIHDVGVTALGLLGLAPPDGWLGTDRSRA